MLISKRTAMKKILIVTNMFPSNSNPSSGIFVKEQIEELTKYVDFDYRVFLIDGKAKGKLEYLKSIFRVPKLIKKYKPDIIHVHYGISGLFLLFHKSRNSKVIVTLHGGDIQEKGSTPLQIFLTKKVVRYADQVFVQNTEMKKIIEKINPTVEIMTCGIDPDFFCTESINIIEDNSTTILFPSSPCRWDKNYPLFEEVIGILKKKGYKNIRIATLENLSREEVRDVMNQSDVLLMTSVSEGSPQAIKEALLCNLPIVSTPVGDVIDIVENIPNCFVSNSHEAIELAELTEKALIGGKKGIREAFLKKDNYFNKNLAERLAIHYGLTFLEK